MKQHDCCCSHCKPGRPAPTQSVLLPRIIASGREWLRRACMDLQVEGMPCCAAPPFALTGVAPAGEPAWEPLGDGCGLRFRVQVPLLCQVRDGCGCMHQGRSTITLEVCLRPHGPAQACWRANLQVLPCVRLICAQCSQTACFAAQLEVVLEAYLLRWEPCATGIPCKPPCPELPLYPPPCCP